MRWRVGAAWALAVLLPDLATRRWPADAIGWATWLAAYAVSLTVWLGVIEALARLRARGAWATVPAMLLVALLLPLWIAGAHGYYATLHTSVPPSAVWFCCRNPRYAYALALEATTAVERALMLASPLVLWALVHRATRPPWPPAPPPLARLRPVAVATMLMLLVAPRALRSSDLDGLRASVGGVAMFLLRARPHLGVPARVRPSPLPPAAERLNVVVIVQESLGAAQWAPWNRTPGSSPGIERLLDEDSAETVWFDDAVTAAGATAVSLPSILTGLAPDAPGEAFTRAPLLWQEARALGYRTALVSAQSYDWLGFRDFFLGAEGPDVAETAAELGGTRVNDHGIDDAAVVAEAARFVDATAPERPFLVVVQLNATHWPCWAPDAPGGEGLEARCARAARYVDDAAMRLVEHLRARGRLEETLILGTSDHGESFRGDRPPRLESYYEDVARVPLWLRLPRAYLARHPEARRALAASALGRVSNLDLYPTLLDLWGRWPLGPGERPRLAGTSLLRPVDADRALVVASTGDIHDFQWSNEGFALYHGRWKWLCDERRGCALFDLVEDPHEERDRRAQATAEERARFAAEVRARPNLRRILAEMDGAAP